jgi:hypothetical protein
MLPLVLWDADLQRGDGLPEHKRQVPKIHLALYPDVVESGGLLRSTDTVFHILEMTIALLSAPAPLYEIILESSRIIASKTEAFPRSVLG